MRRFRVGGGVQWTPDGRRLLYTADTSGAENPHVYMIEPDDPDAKPVDLTPWDGVRAGIHQIVPPAIPARVLVYHNRRDRKVFDLYRIDLATRQETLVAQNPGDAMAPITAADGSFKGWRTSRAAQRRATEAPKPLAARKPGLLKAPDETFQSLGLSADRSVVWAISNRGRDRLALVAADPRLGWEKVVFEDPDVDVSHGHDEPRDASASRGARAARLSARGDPRPETARGPCRAVESAGRQPLRPRYRQHRQATRSA